MNWGYRILILYLAFVAGILFLVYKSGQQHTDLIADNYYEKELQYQQVIDARNNTEPYRNQIELANRDNKVMIRLPLAIGTSILNGTIEFLCMNDKSGDVKLPLKTGADGIQYIAINKFKRGNYQVQVSWSDKNIPYYYESSLQVN